MLFIFYKKKSIQGLKLYLAQTNSLLILIFKRFRRGIINFKITYGVFFSIQNVLEGYTCNKFILFYQELNMSWRRLST